ncbi:MAG: hypothetical protein ACRENP_20605 [Longimicrobiales bacterium]
MCAAGHVLYGVGRTAGGLYTCQHRARNAAAAGRWPERCGRKCYIAGVLDLCIVIDLSDEEFELALRTGTLSPAAHSDLRALVGAALLLPVK